LNSSLNERRVRLLANCCFLLIQSSSKNSLRSNSSVHYFWGTPGFRNFANYRTRILFFCGKLKLKPC